MTKQQNIVVVGAGMVGLSVACLLSRDERFAIKVIDAGQKPEFSVDDDIGLRVSAIAPGSMDMLMKIGAWERIAAERVSAYHDMKVWDAGGHVDGPEALSFGASEFALPQLGFIVENELIRSALQASLQSTNVSLRYESKIDAIRQIGDRFELTLSGGSRMTPDLLIGADGVRSAVRGAANIAVRLWQHDQKAFVTHVRPEKCHNDTAWQRFLKNGPIGLLPLNDGRVSIVWSTSPELADEALNVPDETLGERLTELTDSVLGRLVVAGPRGAFPLQSQHAERYVRPGLVLIGDAAHAIHPLAGQGVNLGFADALLLANTLIERADCGEYVGDVPVLRRYERARSGANQTMLTFVDGLNRLFSNDSESVAHLRRAGMYAFNKSGPLRSYAVEVALGIR